MLSLIALAPFAFPVAASYPQTPSAGSPVGQGNQVAPTAPTGTALGSGAGPPNMFALQAVLLQPTTPGTSQVGNVNHPQHPKFEDFGDALLRGSGGTGYLRVDWFTPEGLGMWGDGRLTVIGTEGFLEVRKNVDIGGRKGGNHLFLVNQKETQYIGCSKVPLPYGKQLVDDILHRTETAMPQAHCFLAMELAIKAQKMARKLTS